MERGKVSTKIVSNYLREELIYGVGYNSVEIIELWFS